MNMRMAIFCASMAEGFLRIGMAAEAAAMYRAAATFAGEAC